MLAHALTLALFCCPVPTSPPTGGFVGQSRSIWTQINNGIGNLDIRNLEIDKEGILYAVCYNGDVYWTNNKGESWQKKGSGNRSNSSDLLIQQSGDLYCAGSYGVFQLKNDSENWIQVNDGLPREG